MDDDRLRFPGCLGAPDLADRDQRGDGRRRQRPSGLVHHKTAVGVAVERQPQIRVVGDDGRLKVAEVLGFQGVGGVVRERAVECEVERNHGERQGRVELVAQDCRYGQACHAVACIHHHFEWPDPVQAYQRTQFFGVAGQDVLLRDVALDPGRGDPGVKVLLGQVPDGVEPGVGGYRHGAGLGHFDAVVFGGVVAGGEDGPGHVQRAARKVELVR